MDQAFILGIFRLQRLDDASLFFPITTHTTTAIAAARNVF
jgi:hypothetical protein